MIEWKSAEMSNRNKHPNQQKQENRQIGLIETMHINFYTSCGQLKTQSVEYMEKQKKNGCISTRDMVRGF